MSVSRPTAKRGAIKKIIITGASGFAGSHLVEALKPEAAKIYCLDLSPSPLLKQLNPHTISIPLNLTDFEQVDEVISQLKPDWVFHLAALAAVGESFRQPQKVIAANISCQVNLLEALRRSHPQAKIVIIGSGDEYGLVEKKYLPISENTPLRPTSPYAVSKITQDLLGLQYHLAHHLNLIRLRPFNHIGERQKVNFVVPDFAHQIAAIEAGQKPPVIHVGNLNAIRDFTDVKDMVQAYVLAVKHGQPGEVYNLGSGKGTKIRTLLLELLALSPKKITIKSDKKLSRPLDVPEIVCDSSKFRRLTHWRPKIPLTTTLTRVLNYWRQNLT